ncbi:histidine phosphatase family protein [Nitrospinota bacterium]
MPAEAVDPTTQIPGREKSPFRILLLRHGAAEGSDRGSFISRTDVDLLPLGVSQVRMAAGRAAPWLEGVPEIPVFSSPLLRARRSAEIFCEELGLPVSSTRIVEEFIELDLGRWEGETYDSLMEKEPDRLRAHYANFVRSKSPKGESVSDLARRVRPAFRSLRRSATGPAAVVVGHAGVNRIILLDALGAPLRNFFRIDVGLGAFSVIDYHGEAPVVRLVNG